MGVAAAWLLVVVALVASLGCSRAQVGLRTAPLTAPRAREAPGPDSGGLGLFSKWSSLDSHKNRTSSIENSLAAIFRGVAYGLSTIPTSTITTSTTTTPAPSLHATASPAGQGHRPQVPDSPGWSDLEGLLFQTTFDELPPEDFDNLYPDSKNEVEVVRAGAGVELSKAAWVRALGMAWVVHVYCAAGMYSLLAVLALLWLSRVHSATRLLPRGYYVTFHLLMFLAAILRCVHLFHDPYGAEHKLPEALAAVVEEVGWPCLTAAMALVVMGVVQAWRCPPHLPHQHHAPAALAVITVFHLMVSICAHLFSVLFPEHAGPLRAAARTATAAWGGVIGVGSFLAVCRVAQAARHRHGHLTVMLSRDAVEGTTQHPRVALLQGVNLALIAAFAQVILAALHLYGLLGPHYILQLPPAHPWHWLAFQSTCCLLELLAWVLLALISLLSVGGSPVKRETRKEANLLSALWCGRCVSQDPSDREVCQGACQDSQAARSYTLQPSTNTGPQQVLTQSYPARHGAHSLRNPPTFRPAASDVHLLWSHSRTQDAFSSNCSSRPSSIVFCDSGPGRFKRPQEPQGEMTESSHKSLQNRETNLGRNCSAPHKAAQEDEPTAYDQHLYYSVAKIPKTSPVKATASPTFGSPLHDTRFQHHMQHHVGGEVESAASDDGQSRSEVVSVTDCSSTDALSPAVVGDNDWSKYTSTCSSVSAANSFDVRMCDDSDVPYYQIPYTASPQPHAPWHQHSPPAHLPLHGDATPPAVHAPFARQADQTKSLQASRTSSPASSHHTEYPVRPHDHTRPLHDLHARGPYPELVAPGSPSHSQQRCQGNMRRELTGLQRPPQLQRRVNIRSAQEDSAVQLQNSKNADETTNTIERLCEVSKAALMSHTNSRVSSKVVRTDSSQSSSGHNTLDSQDVCEVAEKCHRAPLTHHRRRRGERVRPCGHRPRTRQEAAGVRPTSPAVQNQDIPQGEVSHPSHHTQEVAASETEGTTQADVNTAISLSPSSSRAGSSLGSHSDLPSEGADSENEGSLQSRERPHDAKREVVRPPEVPPRRHELPKPINRQGHDP
ncbi:uncharacterized protein [Procambarus clarkii]|uniref:uncharacterized protein n=1 Tax=Procambarus clarkii TaxID=6728 RepID=UPI001E677B49|nr:uncharacterized protein LOC123760048 [Procambarus clarkii]